MCDSYKVVIRPDLMFYTPPNMVHTRNMLRREREQGNFLERNPMEEQGNLEQTQSAPEQKEEAIAHSGSKATLVQTPYKSIPESSASVSTKLQNSVPPPPPPPISIKTRSVSRKSVSSSSSVRARKAELILRAEKMKAEIKMKLIDKQLEADLADLEDKEYSPHDEDNLNRSIEKWVDDSCHELRKMSTENVFGISASEYCPLAPTASGTQLPGRGVPSAHQGTDAPYGNWAEARAAPPALSSFCALPPTTQSAPRGPLVHMNPSAPTAPADLNVLSTAYTAREPTVSLGHNVLQAQKAQPTPATNDSDHTIRMLASAIQNLATTSVTNAPNASFLSRICTPRDLPEFSGDPLDWLQFQHAFYDSTELCKFTPKENIWRLRKCLSGPAKEAVSALLVSASSPDTIMSTLKLRFGNPDYIISKIINDIKRLPPISSDYQKDIVSFSVKIQNFIEAVRAVNREEYLLGMGITSIILSKLPTLLLSKWSDYSYAFITDNKQSRLILLSNFLHEEAVKVSSTCNIHFTSARSEKTITSNKNSEINYHRTHTVLAQAVNNDVISKCQFCRRDNHILTECKQFKKALRKVRWQYVKRNGICYKCLLSRHDRQTCAAPACDENHCGQAHHRLLHYPVNTYEHGDSSSHQDERARPVPPPRSQPSPRPRARPPSPPSTVHAVDRTELVSHINASDFKVLLKVIPIRIHGPNGSVDASALLDDGSTTSLISAGLAERVGLFGRRETLHVTGAWTGNELVCDSVVMKVNLSGADNKVHSIRIRSVEKLNLPTNYLSIVNCNAYKNLMDIKNKLCTSNLKPEILIGQDNYHLLIPLETKVGKLNEPCATLTPLGWCVHGNVHVPRSSHALLSRPPLTPPPAHSTLLVSEDGLDSSHAELLLQDIHEEVRRSFTLDSLGVSGPPRQNADDVRAVAHLEKTAKLVGGRWYVGLPWKNEHCTLPDSYSNALKRLKGIERKMEKDTGFADRYRERIKHLLDNDFARKLDDTNRTSKTWYLPHFGVDNPNKGKLRLVFDCAAKVNGLCLNDYLLTGPDLLLSLLGIMLRFRQNEFAVTGDIKDMFLRVKIHLDDQHAFRFLWRDRPEDPVNTYVMTSLIFGANCSPFVAQFIKNKNALQYESSMPAAADAILNAHYMDDYIHSLRDETSAVQIVNDVTNIHKVGGFEMRNWISNSLAVLNSVPNETLGTAAVKFKVGQQYEGERTLGLIWYPAEDMLGFDVSLKKIPENIIEGKLKPTKRLMLRVIMSVFDVIGFLAPFTIQGRIMLQDTWRLNIGWDDPIPDDIYNKWCQWIELLKDINKLRIPRCYHMAASASEKERKPVLSSYAAAMTAQVLRPPPLQPSRATVPTNSGSAGVASSATNGNATAQYNNLQLHVFSDASTKAMCVVAYWRWINNNNINVAFVASKCRVAPVKPTTVPRLELQAALLAARLAETVLKEHKMLVVQRYFWCDSTTVIHWIKNSTRSYKTFVANRLGEIDELTRADEWRYVPTKLNVADLATREVFDYSLFQNEWIKGPTFLYCEEEMWPTNVLEHHSTESDEATVERVLVTCEPIRNLPVPDPKRFSSWLKLLRATATVLKFIKKCRKSHGEIDCDTMEEAERLLLQHAQSESFAEEIAAIKNGQCLRRSSKLLTLSPYLDEYGVLRLGGRVDAASGVSVETKRPVILDGRHSVAQLIVRDYHVKAAHGNQETVVNQLKQKYWIIKLRPTVKHVVKSCMLCRLRKSQPRVPRMGDLPEGRMAHHQRPFTFCGLDLFGPMEVTVGRRREKRYGALFTCLTVRAVHIELVPSLTSDSLIMAIRRMAARRGWPRHLFSDNGTNLRGADKELLKSIQDLNNEALKAEAANNGMEWKFIPPASPHWGGAWERLIRSVKTSLRVILNERAPREEVLCTLLAEVENIVNSRPLSHVSVEAGNIESLTPNHFLLGSSSNLPVIGAFNNSDLYLKKQWRKAQRLADMFWQRWLKEVFPDLLPRKKWNEEQTPLQVGDLVLVVDPESPRNVWPKGVIQQVYPGKDGRTRVVEVKTKTGIWRRSAARVAPISLSYEC